MKVSIITVCFNAEATIADSLRSVLGQSHSDVEYIIIDGGSTDGTVDVINKKKNASVIFVSESDYGIYDAMNKGIALATGDVIGVLNSDDFYPNSNVISSVVGFFRQTPHTDMVLGDIDFVSPKALNKPLRLYSVAGFKPWKLRFGFMPAHPGAFIKKSAYEQAGDYKLGYKIGADFDMFVRMLLVQKLRYIKLDSVLVRMRVGGVSTSGLTSYVTTTKEILRSLKENGIYSNIWMVLIRLPIKFFQLIPVKLGFK